MIKIAIPLTALALFAFCVLFLRPVPIVAEEDALVVTGVISSINGTKTKDISLWLENNPTHYYINRGMKLGLEVEEMKDKLVGKKVTLKYPKYWSPLDPKNATRHISKLESEGKVWFNELR